MPSTRTPAATGAVDPCAAPLAKLEMGILFREILARMPDLELVEPDAWKPTFVLRGLARLPVRTASGG